MSSLILELADSQLQKLEHLAQRRGVSVDTLVRKILEDLVAQSGDDITQDSIYTIKAHESDAPADLSRQADHYLYEASHRSTL